MCNCGKKRNVFAGQQTNQSKQVHFTQQQPINQNIDVLKTVMFQYTGNTALSVIGSATKKSYRFSFPGDIQHIALSDTAAMAAVPVLKKIEQYY